jgi:hypothetical protein
VFVPVITALRATGEFHPSLAASDAVALPAELSVQVTEVPVCPAAQPPHDIVTGSPSGSDAVAVKVVVHGA